MAWVTPTSVTTGDLITAADWNQDVVDNMLALKNPPTDSYVANRSNWTTTSTSFVNIDGTNLSLTITTTGGDVLVGFHGVFSGANSIGYLDVTVDGTRDGGDDGYLRQYLPTSGEIMGFTRLITGLSAGSHTFNLQWKVSADTLTLYAGAGTSTFDVHPQFWVREVS